MKELLPLIEEIGHSRDENHNMNLKNYDIALIKAIKHLIDYHLYKLGFEFNVSDIAINYDGLIYSVYFQKVDIDVIEDMKQVLEELVDMVQIEAINNIVKVEFVMLFSGLSDKQ